MDGQWTALDVLLSSLYARRAACALLYLQRTEGVAALAERERFGHVDEGGGSRDTRRVRLAWRRKPWRL